MGARAGGADRPARVLAFSVKTSKYRTCAIFAPMYRESQVGSFLRLMPHAGPAGACPLWSILYNILSSLHLSTLAVPSRCAVMSRAIFDAPTMRPMASYIGE